jgi:hypothetical protein
MKKVITLLFWNRPQYVRMVLDYLSNCIGIGDYHLAIILDGPTHPEIRKICSGIKFARCEVHPINRHVGCNGATRIALNRGFELSDYVIHVEDDILLAPDALQYFEWARQFGGDKKLMTIGAIRHPTGWLLEHGPFPVGQEIERKVKRDGGFGVWGWATWKDRWLEFNKIWSTESDIALSWDTRLSRYRNERKLAQLVPLVSRVVNCGAIGGVHRGDYMLSYWAGSNGFQSNPNFYIVP